MALRVKKFALSAAVYKLVEININALKQVFSIKTAISVSLSREEKIF